MTPPSPSTIDLEWLVQTVRVGNLAIPTARVRTAIYLSRVLSASHEYEARLAYHDLMLSCYQSTLRTSTIGWASLSRCSKGLVGCIRTADTLSTSLNALRGLRHD